MIRRIIRIGNSEGVVIPAGVIRAHKLKVGDQVEVLVSPPGEIARRVEFLQELEEFQKARSKPVKKTSEGQLL